MICLGCPSGECIECFEFENGVARKLASVKYLGFNGVAIHGFTIGERMETGIDFEGHFVEVSPIALSVYDVQNNVCKCGFDAPDDVLVIRERRNLELSYGVPKLDGTVFDYVEAVLSPRIANAVIASRPAMVSVMRAPISAWSMEFLFRWLTRRMEKRDVTLIRSAELLVEVFVAMHETKSKE